MKIDVNLINIKSNELLNDDFVVLIDESLNIVKERLFFYKNETEENKYYPNLIKLTDNDDNVILKNQILVDYKIVDKKVYVTCLLDIIEDKIKEHKKTLNDIYDDYKKNNDEFTSMYDKIKYGFFDFTEDDFIGAISIVLKEKYDKLTPEYNIYIKKIQNCYKTVVKNYQSKEESLSDFYTSCKLNDLSQYYNTDTPQISFKDVIVEFKNKNFVNGTKGKFIRLQNIFNQLELSDTIPLIAISNERENPIVKVYNGVSDDVSVKEFKSWLLHDKKEKFGFGAQENKRIITYKKIKGLLIKTKVSKTEFITVNIYENGLIEARVKFSESSDWNNNLEMIIDTLRKTIETCISKINRLNEIYTQSKRLHIDNQRVYDTVQSITCSVELRKKIDLYHMIEKVMDVDYQETLFQAKEGKSEEIISLFYKKFLSSQDEISQQRMKIACSNIPSDLQSERKGITVNIQDNPYSVGSILNIYSASNINEVYLIVDQISYIDKLNTESVAEQKIKEKSNIKNLRSEYNIPILSTSCQKQRQPIIDDTREPLKNMIDSKTKKPLVDSYPLIYKGIRLICPDKEYPYPGFTQKNAICCFTKDQRNNIKYISNMGLEEKVEPSKKQINISKQYILTTDKILEQQKIGTLLPIFDNVFNKLPSNIKDVKNGKFYRMGVAQNNNAFLNAVSMGINGKDIDINTFKGTIVEKLKKNPNLFFKLNNGQIKLKYNNLDNYIKWITDNKNTMNINDLLELLKSIFKYNIVIFTIPMIYSKSTAKINEEMIKLLCHINCKPKEENPYIVIFKRENKYELLIYYNELKIKYSFGLNDSQSFKFINNFYEKTCIKEDIYPKKFTDYKYDMLYHGDELINNLKGTDYEIVGQVSNKHKKVSLLITKNNVVIPIKEATIFLKDGHVINGHGSESIPIQKSPPLIDGNMYLTHLKNINTVLESKGLHTIKIIGITHKNDGLVTNLEGAVVPIVPMQKTDKLNTGVPLPVVNYNYYSLDAINDIDVSDGVKAKNNQEIYTDKYNLVLQEIYVIKQQLSKIIFKSNKLTRYIQKIQTSSEYTIQPRFTLINIYTQFFKNIIDVMKSKHDVIINDNMLYLSIIANEIIDDNKENLFFKGIVQNPNYDINEIKIRENESIIYNIKDFYTFIQTHFTHDTNE